MAVALATSLLVGLAASPALAAPRIAAAANTVGASAAMRLGKSVGSPNAGHLIGGTRLVESPYLRIVPIHAEEDVRWGLGPLVTMIDRAARQVKKQFPDSVLTVGHLSKAGGGEIDNHASHESGRDADLLFFAKDERGKALAPQRFVAYRADGKAPTWPGATFDDARNWLLVTALVTDPAARVSHIFVHSALRARLLAYAERIKAPESVRARAAELMVQPKGVLPHDDHFHVRIACPDGMRECVENPTPRRRLVASRMAHGHAHAEPASKGAPKITETHAESREPAATTNPAPKEPNAESKESPKEAPKAAPTDGVPSAAEVPDPSTPSLPAVLGAPNEPGTEDSDGE